MQAFVTYQQNSDCGPAWDCSLLFIDAADADHGCGRAGDRFDAKQLSNVSKFASRKRCLLSYRKQELSGAKMNSHRTTVHPPPPLNSSSTISSGTFSVATISTVAVSPLVSRTVVRSTGKFCFIFADRPSRADQAFSTGRRRRRIAGKCKPRDLGRRSFLHLGYGS